jgi:hypothetical protein
VATIHSFRPKEDSKNKAPTVDDLKTRIEDLTQEVVSFAMDTSNQAIPFERFERDLRARIFELARTVIVLFLTCAEGSIREQTPTRLVRGIRSFQKTRSRDRSLTTWFGTVRYWRTYMREINDEQGQGFFPLDVALGLVADRFSFGVLALVVRLATKLSFAEAKSTAELFLPVVPSTEVIEKATLGLGAFTVEWFDNAPAPEGDGDVLLILVDSKGAPTVTDRELRRRRRKRKKGSKAKSPRHRGRQCRGRYDALPRRKKGDKSKNAKMATVVVMYTLRSEGTLLLGPINKWSYASFAPKKHAFEVARREANKRGFTADSGQIVQLVTDGDNDLETYAKQIFPEATYHTLDVAHVVERLWEAGGCFHREGSKALRKWIEEQKKLLFAGGIAEVLVNLRKLNKALGRGKKKAKRRERLAEIIKYLKKRQAMMCYGELMDEDFEVGSGAVEGAVKHIIGKRCDQGGMRWIRERAESVIQLRCIELNGDWDRFIEFVHDSQRQRGIEHGLRVRIQRNEPAPLPEVEAA